MRSFSELFTTNENKTRIDNVIDVCSTDELVDYFQQMNPVYLSLLEILFQFELSLEIPQHGVIFNFISLPEKFFSSPIEYDHFTEYLNNIDSFEEFYFLYKFVKNLHDGIVRKLRNEFRPLMKLMRKTNLRMTYLPSGIDTDLFLKIFDNRYYSQILQFETNYNIMSQKQSLVASYLYEKNTGYFEWISGS